MDALVNGHRSEPAAATRTGTLAARIEALRARCAALTPQERSLVLAYLRGRCPELVEEALADAEDAARQRREAIAAARRERERSEAAELQARSVQQQLRRAAETVTAARRSATP